MSSGPGRCCRCDRQRLFQNLQTATPRPRHHTFISKHVGKNTISDVARFGGDAAPGVGNIGVGFLDLALSKTELHKNTGD